MPARPRLRRGLRWCLALSCLLGLTACDGDEAPGPTARPPAAGPTATPSEPPATSPSPRPAPAEPGATPTAETPAELLLVWTLGGLPGGFADAVADLPAVDETTVVAGDLVDLVGSLDADGVPVDVLDAGWAIPVDAIAVDPDAYAAVRVAASSEAAELIAGLAAGEALLGATSAQLRGLEAGATITFGDGTDLDVAGVIADDLVGAAEVVVTRDDAAALGVGTDRYVLARHQGSHDDLEDAVRGLTDRPMRVRAEGEWPWLRHGDAVLPQAYVKADFGEFAYRRTGDGLGIEQDEDWAGEHLRSFEVPRLGAVTCHRAIAEPLRKALSALIEAGLHELVDPTQYAGCHHARLVAADEGVSRHAWGLAVDVNAADNPRGATSTQDPRLVEVFTAAGFAWGGPWLSPDAMHFEYLGSYSDAVPGGDDR